MQPKGTIWDFPFLPPRASTFAVQYDLLFLFLVLVTVVVMAVVGFGTLFIVVRYQKGSKVNRAEKAHTGFGLELVWSAPVLIIGLIVFFWGAALYADVYTPPKDTLEVYVVGKQWMWHLQHPNGVRENDELHVPLGRPIRVIVTSQDVIHSFFIPAFRIKRDAVPGRYNDVWFIPTQEGQYHIFCAEFCGTKHSEMIGTVYVMKPDDYERWLADTAAGVSSTGGGNMVSQGKALYEALGCVTCHTGPHPRGPSHVGLYGSKVKLDTGQVVVADDAYLRESILQSNAKIVAGYARPSIMPTFQGQVNEEQVLDLIAYIKSEKGTGGAAPAAGAANTNSTTNPKPNSNKTGSSQ